MLEFSEARSAADYAAIENLARPIWHECFADIISGAQIDYMLERFLTADVMQQYAHNGYRFWLVAENGDAVGFMSMHAEERRMFLSKVYLLASHRGKGHGRRMLAFADECTRDAGLEAVYLTVNRGNTRAIEVYLRCGYEIIAEQQADIGNGFVMDDYVMERRLPV